MQTICELKNVSKGYGNKQVLENLSLSITKGELLAITGRSGSGKSTLMNMIGLLEQQDDGTITLFGEENVYSNRKLVKSFLRNKIAYLFQNFALIDNTTIDKNLDIPLIHTGYSKNKRRDLKIEALSTVGLTNDLSQKVYELSGGEQQRLAIARILLKPSELILADEPTGSLDEKNQDDILKLLIELNLKGKTVVIVTHDKEVTNACKRVVQIDEEG
ncbi:ABC transporter ATP-binding protein [Ornithinibacillus salinisoli]|uniref:ABC transporter ATP-binding protein n=1 Tax=Ornithinibacillus salinisoli TaxID=1848459 RepID=A0ABW4VVG0_9BACI